MKERKKDGGKNSFQYEWAEIHEFLNSQDRIFSAHFPKWTMEDDILMWYSLLQDYQFHYVMGQISKEELKYC